MPDPDSVAWLDWSDEAFARAEAEQKPVLLAISASWCHWCHVMDATSYSDPAIAAAINERFIPIRVDTDRRPDINERYNLGGWPTTAFLTPRGEILGGGTYVPPDRLAAVLDQVAEAFRARRRDIDVRARAAVERREAEQTATQSPGELDLTAPDWFLERLAAEFDETHGGFGLEPKFPHIAALTFALECYRDSSDSRLSHIVTRSLDAMGWGGLYDDVEGGFFRYCTTRDWLLPHSEKLLEDNAAHIRLYLNAWKLFDHAPYRDKAIDIIRYVQRSLTDSIDGGFFASQRADEAYYSLALIEQRQAVRPPSVDRLLYAGANAVMAGAYLHASDLLGDTSLRDFAIKSLERVLLATYRPGLGLAHYTDGLDAQVRGLLVAQVQTSAALIEAHLNTEQLPWIEMAQELMHYSIRTMWDDDRGGFFDRAAASNDAGEIGLLRDRLRPIGLNAQAARVLLQLAELTKDADFHAYAVKTLASLSRAYRSHGLFAAEYGQAVREFMKRSKVES